MATQGTVKLLSRDSGEEDLLNCNQRPKAKGNSFPDLLHYRSRDNGLTFPQVALK